MCWRLQYHLKQRRSPTECAERPQNSEVLTGWGLQEVADFINGSARQPGAFSALAPRRVQPTVTSMARDIYPSESSHYSPVHAARLCSRPFDFLNPYVFLFRLCHVEAVLVRRDSVRRKDWAERERGGRNTRRMKRM